MRKLVAIIFVVLVLGLGVYSCGDDGGGGSGGDTDNIYNPDEDGDDTEEETEGCMPDCEGKECGWDGCDGNCGTCDAPPLSECVDETTMRTYTGACTDEFVCEYEPQDIQCENICINGACDTCTPEECPAEVECGAWTDACGIEHDCGECNNPPAPECLPNEITLRTYTDVSTCENNRCLYEYVDTPCEHGCVDGHCEGCVPNCTGKECGSDGCGGICGSCDNPPADECVSNNTLRVYNTTGSCADGSCDYRFTDIGCPYGCEETMVDEQPVAQCMGCVPSCEGKECGSDGCNGSCGRCDNPPENECLPDGLTLRYFEDVGSCTESFNCDYEYDDIACSNGCEEVTVEQVDGDVEAGEEEIEADNDGTIAQCVDCVPNCEGKVCGPDGCGGRCGSCALGEICDEVGQCICVNSLCAEVCCEVDAEVCDTENMCCMPELECPAELECGLWNDACGVPHSCGECINGEDCVTNTCECINDRVVCNGICCADSEVCFNDGCCLPNCQGYECGDNGCGGSCGACAANEVCTDHMCVCPNETCNDGCCGSADDVCGPDGNCCTPAQVCPEEIACGMWVDACGVEHDCGGCDNNMVCEANMCVCPESRETCQGVCCDEGDVCANGDGACCTPAAQCPAQVECGRWFDTCGIEHDCGACADGHVCQENECICPEGRTLCEGVCCESGQTCNEGTCCDPIAECDPSYECGAIDNCGEQLNCGDNDGACLNGYECGGENGHTCVCPVERVECGAEGSEVCCDAGAICHGDACCTPLAECPADNCSATVDDTCGGTLDCSSNCEAGEQCISDACCPDGQVCGAEGSESCCTAEQVCFSDSCCTPLTVDECPVGNCSATLDDTCGSTIDCSSNCEAGEQCISDSCCPDARACGSICCPADEICHDAGAETCGAP